jgi:hypothetical protein
MGFKYHPTNQNMSCEPHDRLFLKSEAELQIIHLWLFV